MGAAEMVAETVAEIVAGTWVMVVETWVMVVETWAMVVETWVMVVETWAMVVKIVIVMKMHHLERKERKRVKRSALLEMVQEDSLIKILINVLYPIAHSNISLLCAKKQGVVAEYYLLIVSAV